jgi:hypothetical protein
MKVHGSPPMLGAWRAKKGLRHDLPCVLDALFEPVCCLKKKKRIKLETS